jgi:hypothetical protein
MRQAFRHTLQLFKIVFYYCFLLCAFCAHCTPYTHVDGGEIKWQREREGAAYTCPWLFVLFFAPFFSSLSVCLSVCFFDMITINRIRCVYVVCICVFFSMYSSLCILLYVLFSMYSSLFLSPSLFPHVFKNILHRVVLSKLRCGIVDAQFSFQILQFRTKSRCIRIILHTNVMHTDTVIRRISSASTHSHSRRCRSLLFIVSHAHCLLLRILCVCCCPSCTPCFHFGT